LVKVHRRGKLIDMVVSTAGAFAQEHREEADDGVSLSAEEEAEIEVRIAQTDEEIRAGRAITWERFLEERALRRGG
jgi:hypothetical protein